MAERYVVLNENTLGYTDPSMPDWMMGVLAGSVIKGGYDWKNGPVAISPLDSVRTATVDDFDTFRVCSKGHIT